MNLESDSKTPWKILKTKNASRLPDAFSLVAGTRLERATFGL